MDDRLDLRVRGERLADLGDVGRVGPLADEQALSLDAEDDGHDHQQDTDRDRADRIPHRLAGDDREPDAKEREGQAEQRRDVFQ